uniref:glycosyltransferase family 2 protein n=1 Tax=Gelidibacter sp. TaxID=2018083 RepID=UPI00404B1496
MKLPYFSVVISLYNKEKQIQSTIESVLTQTFIDFEIVVVNDGSTDDSEMIVKSIKDERIHLYSQENQGASSGRNAAISKAKGIYIAFLDADDLWETNYLETINALILAYPNENVFATAVTIETTGGKKPSIYSVQNIKDDAIYVLNYFESSYINTILTSSSTVLHKSVFKKTGTFNSALKSGEDTDLWIRIGLNYKIVFINKRLAMYRYDKQSLSNRTKNIADKPKLDSYIEMEANYHAFKKFMDLNRFSMAIQSKLVYDLESFKVYEKVIDYHNLNKKQRFLIKQPIFIVQLFHFIKRLTQRFGIHLSAFR